MTIHNVRRENEHPLAGSPASALSIDSVEARRTSRAASITGWMCQIGLGLTIAGGGVSKLVADPVMVEMFDDIGAGQWLRLVIGVFEIAGGVGLLIPRVRALAALCLFVLLIGATFTNVVILQTSPVVALACAAAALVILVVRRVELPYLVDISFDNHSHLRSDSIP